MDESDVREIVDQNIRLMRWALQLQKWDVSVAYDAEGHLGHAAIDADRQVATIRFCPGRHADRAEVLDTLLHEMVHLMAAPFVVYAEAVKRCVSEDQCAALDVLYDHAAEQSRLAVANMLEHGLGLPVNKMLQRARRRIKDWQP